MPTCPSSVRTTAVRLPSFLALIPVFVFSCAFAADSPDEVAIRKIIDEDVAAWNAGDGTAYAAHFAEEGSFTNLFGMVMYGRADFAKRHAHILGSFYLHTTKKEMVKRIRFITPDVAIVDIDNEIHHVTAMPPGIPVPADGVVRTQLMQVFVKRDGTWWIEAYHNVDRKSSALTGR